MTKGRLSFSHANQVGHVLEGLPGGPVMVSHHDTRHIPDIASDYLVRITLPGDVEITITDRARLTYHLSAPRQIHFERITRTLQGDGFHFLPRPPQTPAP